MNGGITFEKVYEIEEKAAHRVVYADHRELEEEIIKRHIACEEMDEEPGASAPVA